MDPQVEAAFDAWLASIGMNRSSQVPYGQEAYFAQQWEFYLLQWGQSQGRTIVAPPAPARNPLARPGTAQNPIRLAPNNPGAGL